MNRKGQTIMLAILSGVFIFLAGIIFINFLFDDVDVARSMLACSDASSISDGIKLTCLFIDAVIPYWIVLIVSASGGMIFARLVT